MRTNFLAAAVLLAVLAAACEGNQTHPAGPGPYPTSSATPLACTPNLDGQIDANEMLPAIGVPARFLVSPPGVERTVDQTGMGGPTGATWDWSAAAAGDLDFELVGTALAGKWYAASFPTGQFTAPIDAAHGTEGVYRSDASGIYLLGVASTVEQPVAGKTLLPYVQPIALYKFPLKAGDAWTSSGQIMNGTFSGIPYAGLDTYDVAVDGKGELQLPDLTFTQVLRVRTHVTVTPVVGVIATRRLTSFLFECFGEVARATSDLDEPNQNFTTASEIRRLGMPAAN